MGKIVFDEDLNGTRVRAEIEVAAANALRSITRTRLIMEAGDFPRGENDQPPNGIEVDRWMLRRTVYPDMIAATIGGWVEIGDQRYAMPDMPFDVFADGVPFKLLIDWEQAAYAANPHWLPENAESKKKAPPSGSGDMRLSTEPQKTTRSRKRST
jgi:hypothetical protein